MKTKRKPQLFMSLVQRSPLCSSVFYELSAREPIYDISELTRVEYDILEDCTITGMAFFVSRTSRTVVHEASFISARRMISSDVLNTTWRFAPLDLPNGVKLPIGPVMDYILDGLRKGVVGAAVPMEEMP